MAYNQNIPQASDVKSQSQADLLANFQALYTFLNVNHANFGSGEGKHKFVSMPVQVSTPTFDAGDDGLYNKLYATTNKNELYVHKQSQSGTAEIPCTATSANIAAPTANTAGWTYLPSGIILRWGSVTGTGLTTATLTGTAPAFTAMLSILVSPYSASTSDDNFAVRLVSFDNTTQFKVFFSSRTGTGAAAGGCQYLIIGV